MRGTGLDPAPFAWRPCGALSCARNDALLFLQYSARGSGWCRYSVPLAFLHSCSRSDLIHRNDSLFLVSLVADCPPLPSPLDLLFRAFASLNFLELRLRIYSYYLCFITSLPVAGEDFSSLSHL